MKTQEGGPNVSIKVGQAALSKASAGSCPTVAAKIEPRGSFRVSEV